MCVERPLRFFSSKLFTSTSYPSLGNAHHIHLGISEDFTIAALCARRCFMRLNKDAMARSHKTPLVYKLIKYPAYLAVNTKRLKFFAHKSRVSAVAQELLNFLLYGQSALLLCHNHASSCQFRTY